MRAPRSVVLLSLAAALPAAACGRPAQSAGTTRTLPVRVASVESRTLQQTLVLTGTLRPRAQVQVVAEVPGRLLRVVRDEGDRVGEGEVLALLDDTDHRLAHDRATAALGVAQANSTHAQAEKERADNLVKTGGITDKDRLAAEVGLQVAQAGLAQARAEAAIAASRHERARIKAPFAGRVARRLADPGAMLAASAPVFTLVDDAVYEFRSSVPSADYGKARLGAPVEMTVDALPGTTLRGRVARIAPLVDERTRAFEVVVQVPRSPELVGGLFARATVRVGEVAGALVVPPSALVREGAEPDRAHVYVVEQGKAVRREVRLGIETPDAVQVAEGVTGRDLVVLDPPTALVSGAPVDARAAGAGAAAGN